MDIVKKIKDIIGNLQGSERSSIVIKNAILSVLFKGLSILVSLLLVPISIKFIGKDQYGIWLVISSMIAWIAILDIGLTNGLRNKLVKALSKKDFNLAKTYVSTTYITLSAIFLFIWILFYFVNTYLNWSSILNISSELEDSIREIILIVFSYFCLSFLLKTINSILLADQKAAYSAIIDTVGQFFALISIYLMFRFLPGSLLYLCLGMCIAPIIIAVLFNLFLFRGRYKFITPSFKFFRIWCIKDLVGLSFKFFVIQVAVIIQYQTANIIIAKLFGMEDVTNYNVTFRYFGILSTFFGILLLPLWSAVTDAYNKHDYQWVLSSMKKYLFLFALLSIIGLFMLFVSDFAYLVWIGKDNELNIPFSLSLCCFLYTLVNMFGGVFVSTLNGIGAIRIQFLLSLFTPILYVVLCLFFIGYLKMGIYSVFIAAIISNINGFIIAPMQFVKIFIQNKKGIWAA